MKVCGSAAASCPPGAEGDGLVALMPSGAGRARAGTHAAAGAALLILFLLGACGDGGATKEQVQSRDEAPSAPAAREAGTPPPSPEGGAPAQGASTQYELLDVPGWDLQEAVDYRAGLGSLGAAEPDLDWYAEYVGPQIDNDDGSWTVPGVSVTGHTAGLEERRGQLAGFELRSEDVGGRRALVAAATERGPAIVTVELAPDYSVTILSYDDVVDLHELAARLVPVDEQRWVAAGGRMLECVPFEPGCPPVE